MQAKLSSCGRAKMSLTLAEINEEAHIDVRADSTAQFSDVIIA